MSWWRIPLWFLIRVFGLRKWFCGSGEPTEDDWRNPFWRWTEANAINRPFSFQVKDIRFGFFRKSDGKWVWYQNRSWRVWLPGEDANFYNGIFTFSRTVTSGWNRQGVYVQKGRFNIVIRLFSSWWFAFGVGTLPDRGEFGWTGPWFFGFQSQLEHNPGCIARDHEEGAV